MRTTTRSEEPLCSHPPASFLASRTSWNGLAAKREKLASRGLMEIGTYIVDFVFSGIQPAVQDVVVDGVIEEHHVLGDLTHDAPQTANVYLSNITK